MIKRIIISLLGIIITGLAVSIIKIANFGTDPYQCLTFGLNNIFENYSYAVVSLVLNLLLMLTTLIFDKKYIGLATIINVFLLGYVIKFFIQIFSFLPIDSIYLRSVYFLLAYILLCFGNSLYISVNLGVSSYDAQALMLSEKLNLPFKYIRILTDIICVFLGYIFGATVGIGTLITALAMGPLIHHFNAFLKKRLQIM